MPTITPPRPPPGPDCSRLRTESGIFIVPIGGLMLSPSISPGRKFIDGEPMKPATNRFFGRAVELARRADLLQECRRA